jgi:hypothetical protein
MFVAEGTPAGPVPQHWKVQVLPWSVLVYTP